MTIAIAVPAMPTDSKAAPTMSTTFEDVSCEGSFSPGASAGISSLVPVVGISVKITLSETVGSVTTVVVPTVVSDVTVAGHVVVTIGSVVVISGKVVVTIGSVVVISGKVVVMTGSAVVSGGNMVVLSPTSTIPRCALTILAISA